MNIIGTCIGAHKWDGGNGSKDTDTILCYCTESPKVVLEKLIKRHVIYSYMSKVWAAPINEYPSNCSGISISPIIDFDTFKPGLFVEVVGSIDTFIKQGMFDAYIWDKFTKDKFKLVIDRLSHYSLTNDAYNDIVNEYIDIYNRLK